MKVLKRDGSFENYDCKKIKKAIEFACSGLDVNPLKLEAKFDEFLYDGVPTKTIQENLVIHARNLASVSDDKWVYVAGRLSTMNRWNETKVYEKSFCRFVRNMQKEGKYKNTALDKFSDDEIRELGKEINQDYDLAHSISSVVTFVSKYLMKEECIQQAMMVNAMIYASVEKTSEIRIAKAKRWYHKFGKREISKATPHWTGLRQGGSVGSCFVLGISDNTESIMENAKNVAKISSEGGGVGVYWGYVRAKGDSLMGEAGLSGGVTPMMKIFNDIIIAFNQRGKRKGAITCALPIWHSDIYDFLDQRSEVGDIRTKSFDTQLQIVIPDLFMKMRKENKDQDWHTFSPFEIKNVLGFEINDYWGDEFESKYSDCVKAYKGGLLKCVNVYKINDLWKHFLTVVFEKGVPYVCFVDEVNRKNPNNHEGKIHCFNLCQESSSNFKPDVYVHTCSLLSIVMGRMNDKQHIIETARDCTRILANALELTKAPIKDSEAHIDRYRTIGVGTQGLVDLLAKEWKTYSNFEYLTEVAELIQWGCVVESIELAKERGAYKAFKGSRWDSGEQFDDYIRDSVSDLTDWEWAKEQCKLYGVNLSQHTSPAPNTSTSIAMDAQAGYGAPFKAFFYEDNKDGKLPVTSMYLSENPLIYSKTIGTYDQNVLTKSVGALQKFFDTAISAEYLLDRNVRDITAKMISDLYDSAWINKNKTVYYLRTVKKGDEGQIEEPICASCAS